MSSSRDQQIAQARELDRISTLLIDVGVRTVKRNPIKVSLYVVGLAICLFFNGIKMSSEQAKAFETDMSKYDYERIDRAALKAERLSSVYYRSKGWFTCDPSCQLNKAAMQEAISYHRVVLGEENAKISEAKSKVGIFSDYGVSETRNLFWERFGQGKKLYS